MPYFWKHKLAPLAFTVPLLFTAMAFWPLYRQHRQQQEACRRWASSGRPCRRWPSRWARETGAFDTIGIGAWLLVVTVIFLAFKGITRYLARGRRAVTSSSAS